MIIPLTILSISTALAEEYSKVEGNLTVITSPTKIKPGNSIFHTVIIENGNTAKINVTEIEVKSTWNYVYSIPSLELEKNQTKMVSFNYSIPEHIVPGTHNIVVDVKNELGDEIFHQSGLSVEISDLIVVNLASIAALLAAYVIPAQAIERILEITKLGKFTHIENSEIMNLVTNTRTHKDPSFKKMLNAIPEHRHLIDVLKIGKTTFIKLKDMYFEKISKKDIEELQTLLKSKVDAKTKLLSSDEIESIITSYKENNLSKEQLLTNNLTVINLDYIISGFESEIAHQEIKKALYIWAHGLWMSAIPAAVFAYFGLGILQIMGLSSPVVAWSDFFY